MYKRNAGKVLILMKNTMMGILFIMQLFLFNTAPNAAGFDAHQILDTIPVLTRYTGGTVKDSGQALKMAEGNFIKNGLWKSFHPNGTLKDSAYFLNAELVGERKVYRSNGGLKQHFIVSDFNDSLKLISGKIYRSNGKLKAEGQILDGKTFGELQKYRFGKPWLYSDMHKGKRVYIPLQYRRGRHITDENIKAQIVAENAFLDNDGKTKKLARGTIVKIGLKNDSTMLAHCLVEGFSPDAMIVSAFSYDMTESRSPLKFDSVMVVSLSDIQSLEFSRKRVNAIFWTAFTLHISGAVILADGLLLPPIFGTPEDIVSPFMLGFYAIGVACYIPGKLLYRLTVPKEYDLQRDWKFEVRTQARAR